jgi:hypothetical protein
MKQDVVTESEFAARRHLLDVAAFHARRCPSDEDQQRVEDVYCHFEVRILEWIQAMQREAAAAGGLGVARWWQGLVRCAVCSSVWLVVVRVEDWGAPTGLQCPRCHSDEGEPLSREG